MSFEYNGKMAGLLYSFSASWRALSDRLAGAGARWRGIGLTNKVINVMQCINKNMFVIYRVDFRSLTLAKCLKKN